VGARPVPALARSASAVLSSLEALLLLVLLLIRRLRYAAACTSRRVGIARDRSRAPTSSWASRSPRAVICCESAVSRMRHGTATNTAVSSLKGAAMKPPGPQASADRPEIVEWYQVSAAEAARLLKVTNSGLSYAGARQRLEQYGANEVQEQGNRSRWQILVSQLTGVMTLVLIAAAVISVFLGDVVDAVVILAIVVLNAALGYSQEYRAEQSMAALKRLSAPTVRVRRDGTVGEVSARELVPGDVVLLETGNVVPADGRLVQTTNLRIEEAALTGESEAVEKNAQVVFNADRAVGDRHNMAHSGTVVIYGHGEMLVTATGMHTQLGTIAGLIQSVTQEKTPLQQRLDRMGKILAAAALGLVVIVFALGVLRGADWREMLLTSISLAVAAIPEAMTAVVTIALSLGAQRMLKRQALIRQLPAVETLGSVTVICSDKTGTLTQNRMTVTVLDIANRRVDLTRLANGLGFGRVPGEGAKSVARTGPTLDLLLIGAALCNDASLQSVDNGAQRAFRSVGDPTEAALVLAAAEFGILKGDLDEALPRVAELPFDSERKRMTTVHRVSRSRAQLPPSLAAVWDRDASLANPPPYLAVTKGAIDGMLGLTAAVWMDGRSEPIDDAWRARIMTAHDDLAAKGMRILGVGVRLVQAAPDADAVRHLEQGITLIGLVGMMDPPRPEAREAVRLCKAAGIRPVMITGDHPLTARHIAQAVGIAEDDRFLMGQDLEHMPDADLRRAAADVAVFARVSPEHKIRLVQAYQAENNIVAMTGDGVNDAPALKKANIGIAMGISGTDVAKSAAKMVLLDDNFATIVAAVQEGRVVYDNIRRFIKYLLTCNASEIAVMLFGPLLGMPLPLQALQILWMNLVTDGLPALALGIEPAEADVMARPPQAAKESIFGRGMVSFTIVLGVVLSVVCIGVGLTALRRGDPHWQTLLFTTLVFSQMALALGVRSESRPLWSIGLSSNPAMLGAVLLTVVLQLLVVFVPPLQTIFGTTALPPQDLLLAGGAAGSVLLIVEGWKWGYRRRTPSTTRHYFPASADHGR
jgi:P-type Ca2+ transporter type 2C